MKHIELKDAEIFEKETNKTYEYNLPDKDINWCLVDVKGRFPAKGWGVNKVCKGIYFVISGKGKLFVKGKPEIEFDKDDILFIEPNEIFHWEADCRFGIACAPAWYPEQQEIILD